MPGHTGYASSLKRKLQLVYARHVALSDKYGWKRPVAWQKEISELWEKANIDVSRFPQIQDVNAVKADWLIKEIDLAFTAWQENVYTKETPFEDFCHYILPYRFNDRFGLGNSRADLHIRCLTCFFRNEL